MPKNCFLDSLLAAEIGKHSDTSEHRDSSHPFSQTDGSISNTQALAIEDPLKYPLLGGATDLAVQTFSNRPHSSTYPEKFYLMH